VLDGLACIAISEDASRIAAGSASGVLVSWDVVKLAQGAALTEQNATQKWGNSPSRIFKLAFSADGQTLASWTRDGIRVQAVNARRWGWKSKNVPAPTWGALSPDGRVAGAVTGGVVERWDLERGKPLDTPAGHFGSPVFVAFSHDGKRLATGGNDRTLQLWNATSLEWTSSFQGHGQGLTSACFSPDDRWLAAPSADSNVYVWRVEEGMAAKQVSYPNGFFDSTGTTGPWRTSGIDSVSGPSFTADGGSYQHAGYGRFRVSDASAILPRRLFTSTLGWSSNLDRVIVASGANLVMHDVETMRQSTLSLEVSALRALMPETHINFENVTAVPLDANRFVIGFTSSAASGFLMLEDGNVNLNPRRAYNLGLWDDAKADWIWTKRFDQRPVAPGAGVDGLLAIPAKHDEQSTGKEAYVVLGLDGRTIIISATTSETIISLTTNSRKPVGRPLPYSLSPDRELIATFADGFVNIWSFRSKAFVSQRRILGDACALSHSGTLIATWMGRDWGKPEPTQNVSVWEIATAKRIDEFASPFRPAVAFLAGDRRLISAGPSGAVIRDPANRESVLTLAYPAIKTVNDFIADENIALSPDGRTIIAVFSGGGAQHLQTLQAWIADPPPASGTEK
jgi:WD40 repeat protein